MSLVILFLLLGIATADVGEISDDVMAEDLVRAFPDPVKDIAGQIRNILPGNAKLVWDLTKKIFDNLDKANFSAFLTSAAELVGALFPQEPVPEVLERLWADQPGNSSIRPFKVHFSEEMIADLRKRILERRNITSSLKDAGNTYGTNSEFLNQFLDYWANNYSFQERQDLLNKYPQFVTNIQGLDIHFIHVKSPNPYQKKVLPLLLLHGWPATAFEYVHVIDILIQGCEECDFVFDVVVPDLPGFGYSQATNQIGLSTYQMGVIMKNLMRRLGKPRFYIHAGDIGHSVADGMAVLYPDKVLGFHSNFPNSLGPKTLVKYVLGQLNPSAVVEPQYESRMYPLTYWAKFYLVNFGYLHIQATRPDNIGHGLDASPVTLASWIFENTIVATAPRNLSTINGNLPQHFDMLDWFDDLTVYWTAKCGATSVRAYAESLAKVQDPVTGIISSTPTPVPFAAIKFRNELIYQPDDFIKDKYPNLLQSTTLDFGGHFAGFEEPAALADSIWTSVKKMEAFNA